MSKRFTISLRSREPSGFGLIEVLIAAAIAAIVCGALMQMFRFMGKATSRTQQSGDFFSAEQTARMVVLNSDLCRCNLARSGGKPRSFPVANTATTVFDLGSLSLYDNACTKGATLISTNAPGAALSVDSLQLKSFSRIGDYSYAAQVVIHATMSRGTSSALQQQFLVLFYTTTSGGQVSLNACQP